MLRNTSLFLLLCLLMACQPEEHITPSHAVVQEQLRTQVELPAYIDDLHPSVLQSDWWKELHPTSQRYIGMELAQHGQAITFAELQDRLTQSWGLSAAKVNICPGYPTNNPAGDVILNSQADINAFGALNCKEIVGVLDIIDTLGSDPICDLNPLRKLKEVGSSLTIDSDCLTSLAGLEKLKSIGKLGPFGFFGVNGDNLTDIEALDKLSTVTGSINIINCDQLVSVTSAFSKITTIESGKSAQPLTSVFVLNIDDNDVLTDLSAFSTLTYIEGSLRILTNAKLQNLDDFSGLNSIGDDIFILENAALNNVNELSNISSLNDDLFVFDNPSLTQCCGLYSLLCSNPPACSSDGVGDGIAIFNNGAGCTEADIVNNGPCL